LVLAGALASPDAELRDLTASFSGCGGWPDQWTLARACGRPEYEVVAHIVLGPVTAPNQIPPLVPIRVCQVQVVDDPLGQYADVSRPSELHVTITVSLPLKPGFYPPFTPYPGPKPPGHVLPMPGVDSNHRRRPAHHDPAATPAHRGSARADCLKLWRLIHCTKYDSIWDHLHMLNPEWVMNTKLAK
jgi:hypothetical protein